MLLSTASGELPRRAPTDVISNGFLSSCVPNNTPSTKGEKRARDIADNLFRSDNKGLFLDMYDKFLFFFLAPSSR
jgi:hypothetical protein